MPGSKRKQGGRAMEDQACKSGFSEMMIIHPHAAGIDIGATEDWVACPSKDGKPNVRTFKTDTKSPNELADWLSSEGVATVAMESTGVYWIPLFELLEARKFQLILADSRTLGRVPGRKTDMLDCQWLQQLHTYGMLRGCFRPKDATLVLRSLLRMQRTIKAQQDDWVRRMQKALDQMNVRVHRAVSDVTSKTGMRILRAIVAGERDPSKRAGLRDPRCHKRGIEIERELTGNWREEQPQGGRSSRLCHGPQDCPTYLSCAGVWHRVCHRRHRGRRPQSRGSQACPSGAAGGDFGIKGRCRRMRVTILFTTNSHF